LEKLPQKRADELEEIRGDGALFRPYQSVSLSVEPPRIDPSRESDMTKPQSQTRAEKHSAVFRNFDNLPNAAHVRQPVVEMLYSSSSSALWRGVEAGKIPAPHKIGLGITAWNVGEHRQALGCPQ
jgi:predicted DNA-binding transcriptional regulator AlpA